MKTLRYIASIFSLVAAGAAPLKDSIKIEAMIVTKAELRRQGRSVSSKLTDVPRRCHAVLMTARSGKHYEIPIEVIEDFTTVACTWLISDPEIEHLFDEAIRRARKRHGV